MVEFALIGNIGQIGKSYALFVLLNCFLKKTGYFRFAGMYPPLRIAYFVFPFHVDHLQLRFVSYPISYLGVGSASQAFWYLPPPTLSSSPSNISIYLAHFTISPTQLLRSEFIRGNRPSRRRLRFWFTKTAKAHKSSVLGRVIFAQREMRLLGSHYQWCTVNTKLGR